MAGFLIVGITLGSAEAVILLGKTVMFVDYPSKLSYLNHLSLILARDMSCIANLV